MDADTCACTCVFIFLLLQHVSGLWPFVVISKLKKTNK